MPGRSTKTNLASYNWTWPSTKNLSLKLAWIWIAQSGVNFWRQLCPVNGTSRIESDNDNDVGDRNSLQNKTEFKEFVVCTTLEVTHFHTSNVKCSKLMATEPGWCIGRGHGSWACRLCWDALTMKLCLLTNTNKTNINQFKWLLLH